MWEAECREVKNLFPYSLGENLCNLQLHMLGFSTGLGDKGKKIKIPLKRHSHGLDGSELRFFLDQMILGFDFGFGPVKYGWYWADSQVKMLLVRSLVL